MKAGDKLVGATGLHRMDFKNRHASFGISIGDKSEWGKGYGTEATSLIVGIWVLKEQVESTCPRLDALLVLEHKVAQA